MLQAIFHYITLRRISPCLPPYDVESTIYYLSVIADFVSKEYLLGLDGTLAVGFWRR